MTQLFVIIGPRTFSAGVNAAAYFERETHALFVGEPTGGKPNSPGDETFFTLPYSKIAVNFSHVYWESGWPYDARWSIAQHLYAANVRAVRRRRRLGDGCRAWAGRCVPVCGKLRRPRDFLERLGGVAPAPPPFLRCVKELDFYL
ncbi:MAG: hypothetical protein WAK11_11480 [Candidatus Cybelea sp.]